MVVLILEEFVLVSCLSMLGGVGAYLQGVREGKITASFLNLLTELTLSLTVGLAIAYIGHSRDIEPAIVCALALIFGNNGADTISFFRTLIKDFVTNRLGVKK